MAEQIRVEDLDQSEIDQISNWALNNSALDLSESNRWILRGFLPRSLNNSDTDRQKTYNILLNDIIFKLKPLYDHNNQSSN